MPIVYFTSHLQHFIDCPALEIAGDNVRTVLDKVFALNPKLRSYVLDDQAPLEFIPRIRTQHVPSASDQCAFRSAAKWP